MVSAAEDSSLENLCKEAAQKIAQADFFLLATGAGFSADSGLAVYKDIANVPAYHQRKLTYPAICNPKWIDEDPELFYGFWGKCFNDYRDTAPHEGYSIVMNWKKKLFSSSTEAGELLKKEWEDKGYHGTPQIPGPFFIFTSNVDHHSITAGFSPEEVHEIHGTTEVWQCSDPHNCKSVVWNAPSEEDFRFEVDPQTMLAPEQRTEKKDNEKENATETGDDNKEEKEPSVSSIEKKLQVVTLQEKQPNGFESNHPRCIYCNRLARPAILMFGDWQWVSPKPHGKFRTWDRCVSEIINQHNKKLVIVEIGCGKNVPTVRYTTEEIVQRLPDNTTLIRINPDFPLADDDETKSIISIKSKGLHALKLIDASLQTLLKK